MGIVAQGYQLRNWNGLLAIREMAWERSIDTFHDRLLAEEMGVPRIGSDGNHAREPKARTSLEQVLEMGEPVDLARQ